MKYVIVPQWLMRSLQENGVGLEVLEDNEKLCSILSPVEISFYFEANWCAWGKRLTRGSDRKMMERVEKHCEPLTMQDSLITKVAKKEFQIAGTRTLHELVMGPCYLNEPSDVRLHMLCLKPVLIGRDVLGLIPMCTNTSPDNLARRDLYHVMHHFMSSDEIINSPIFGV